MRAKNADALCRPAAAGYTARPYERALQLRIGVDLDSDLTVVNKLTK